MIDWQESAKQNNMTVNDLQDYFKRFPNSGKKIVAICNHCDTIRIVQKCAYRDLCNPCSVQTPEFKQKLSIVNKGKNNNNWQGGGVTLICDWCEKEYKSYDITSHFCCQKCYGKFLSQERNGQNAPAWKGGLSFGKYCSLFNNKFKIQVRNSYNNRCFLCGKSKEDNGKELDVHHVNYDKNCLCGLLCEFVPLCHPCHSRTNGNRKYWEDLIIHYLYPDRYFIVDI